MRLEVDVPRATVAHDGARLRNGCTAFAQRHQLSSERVRFRRTAGPPVLQSFSVKLLEDRAGKQRQRGDGCRLAVQRPL